MERQLRIDELLDGSVRGAWYKNDKRVSEYFHGQNMMEFIQLISMIYGVAA